MLDRLRAAVRDVLEQILAEDRRIDYKSLYPARVVRMTGGDVEVAFEDPENRLEFAPPIRARPSPGESVDWQPGTRLLVGWEMGEEGRRPFILPSWGGGGGLSSAIRKFASSLVSRGPLHVFEVDPDGSPTPNGRQLVEVDGAIGARRLRARGPAPTLTSLSSDVVDVELLSGGDLGACVQFVVNQALPIGTPIFRMNYGNGAYPSLPVVSGQIIAPIGTVLGLLPANDSVIASVGLAPAALPVGTYIATIRTTY